MKIPKRIAHPVFAEQTAVVLSAEQMVKKMILYVCETVEGGVRRGGILRADVRSGSSRCCGEDRCLRGAARSDT